MGWPSKEEILINNAVEALKEDYQFLLRLCLPLGKSSNVDKSGAERIFYETEKYPLHKICENAGFTDPYSPV